MIIPAAGLFTSWRTLPCDAYFNQLPTVDNILHQLILGKYPTIYRVLNGFYIFLQPVAPGMGLISEPSASQLLRLYSFTSVPLLQPQSHPSTGAGLVESCVKLAFFGQYSD